MSRKGYHKFITILIISFKCHRYYYHLLQLVVVNTMFVNTNINKIVVPSKIETISSVQHKTNNYYPVNTLYYILRYDNMIIVSII